MIWLLLTITSIVVIQVYFSTKFSRYAISIETPNNLVSNNSFLIKKYDSADLYKHRHSFLLAGLVISLCINITVIEYGIKKINYEEHIPSSTEYEEELFDIPITTSNPPPPTPQQIQQIIQVPEEKLIDDDELIFPENETQMVSAGFDPVETDEDIEEPPIDEPPLDPSDLQVQPEFSVNIMKYIYENFKISHQDHAEIEGKIIVKFIVDKQGNISNVEILRGLHKSLDNEAIRVIKSIPKAKPGKNGGAPCNVRYTIPIKIKISE